MFPRVIPKMLRGIVCCNSLGGGQTRRVNFSPRLNSRGFLLWRAIPTSDVRDRSTSSWPAPISAIHVFARRRDVGRRGLSSDQVRDGRDEMEASRVSALAVRAGRGLRESAAGNQQHHNDNKKEQPQPRDGRRYPDVPQGANKPDKQNLAGEYERSTHRIAEIVSWLTSMSSCSPTVLSSPSFEGGTGGSMFDP